MAPEAGKQLFSAREWLALFPYPVPPAPRRWKGAPAAPADLREAEPLSARSVLDHLRPKGRWLYFALFRYKLAYPDVYTFFVSFFPLGTFAAWLPLLVVLAVYCQFWWKGRLFAVPKERHFVGGLAAVAATVRYDQLVAEDPDSPLLAHDDAHGKKTCPCPRPGCAERLLALDAVMRLGDWVFFAGSQISLLVLTFWTPFVTYAGTFWRTPYMAFVGILAVSLELFADGLVVGCLRSTVIPVSASLALETAMRERAVGAALSDLLDRVHSEAESQADLAPAPPADPDPYMHLHGALVAAWGVRFGNLYIITRALFLLVAIALVVAFVLNAAAGSCVAAWQLGWLIHTLCFAAVELSIYASANSQITAVLGLYADARGDLRALAARTDPSRTALLARLSAHDRVLKWYTDEAEGARAKMFGFPITGGVIRALLVTLFTIGVGLWTVLRGNAIFLTVETFCPAVKG